MTVVDSLPHGQWAEEEGPARVGGGETVRREIRFGNEICISSLILRSATDLRGECLMENLHDRIKDGITCAYKFFSQFSKSLENRSSCTIFQAGTQNVAQDFSYLSKERSFGWRDFDRGKKGTYLFSQTRRRRFATGIT